MGVSGGACAVWVCICFLACILLSISIAKEKSKTVDRELLRRASTNRNQTLPAFGRNARPPAKGGDVRE